MTGFKCKYLQLQNLIVEFNCIQLAFLVVSSINTTGVIEIKTT